MIEGPNVRSFQCSICEDPSTEICIYCTKDACENHLCDRCHRCSDCCECPMSYNEEPYAKNGDVPAAVIDQS